MSVVLLDPRFPAMLPVEAVPLLGDDVCYTEEVPVRIRWVIADLGGHTVDDTEVIVTTDLANEAVMERLERGDKLVKAPSLLMEMAGDREIEAASDPALTATTGQQPAAVDYSGGGVVDGEIVGTDDHTAAVAGLRRTSRTEVPSSVMDEVEDAVALMTRAMRQGEWEQSQTHHSLLAYLRGRRPRNWPRSSTRWDPVRTSPGSTSRSCARNCRTSCCRCSSTRRSRTGGARSTSGMSPVHSWRRCGHGRRTSSRTWSVRCPVTSRTACGPRDGSVRGSRRTRRGDTP